MKFRALAAVSLIIPLYSQTLTYPETRKSDHVDVYHGIRVADPYRWLEDDRSEETARWVEAQNKLTFAYLARISYRAQLRKRIEQLYNYPKFTPPVRRGEYYFFSKNDGLQNQDVIYIQKGLDGHPEILLDPNQLSADGTARLGIRAWSCDGRYFAYGISSGGSDWQEARVMEVATRKVLDDRINWIKASNLAWAGNGFFYSRYDAPAAGHELSSKNEYHKVYFHRVGTSQAQDELIYEDPANPQRFHIVDTTEDERFAILDVSERGKGKDGNALFYRDLSRPGAGFVPIVQEITNDRYSVIDDTEHGFLIETNHGAPNNKVVRFDSGKPTAAWTDIIPEKPETIASATAAGGRLFVNYIQDVASRVYVYGRDGKLETEIRLPGAGTAGGFDGNHDDRSVFYTYTSLNYPLTIFRYEVASGKSSAFRSPDIPGFNPDNLESKQVFYTSKDGIRIPMFLVHRKGLKLDGRNPTLLYAYGGFNITINPGIRFAAGGADRTGICLRDRQHPRGRRVRREVARSGNEAAQAERVRRLHRGRRVADRGQVYVAGQTGDQRRVERRPAGGGRDESTAGPFPSGDSAGGRDGHAAVPQVHDWLELDTRLRIE